MGYCVKLIVPTGNELQTAPIVGKIIGRWGGCTITSGKGWWVDKKLGQIHDVLTIIECSIGSFDHKARMWWEDLAADVCCTFEQTCVFLSTAQETAMLIDHDGVGRHVGGD